MSEQTTVITCPKCHSTNWRCWDERTFDCWTPDGDPCGTKVVGYLACKDCGETWTDVSDDPSEDGLCECEDD